MATYAKPYRAIPDQLALIESRGMSIPDRTKAEEYLRRIGYYRLSAYWYPFRQRLTDTSGSHKIADDYKPGTDFQTIIELYAFDKALRLIMLDGLERVEVSVRTEVALALGRYDPCAHRDGQFFDARFGKAPSWAQTSRHEEWVARLDKKAAESKEEFADHFRRKYPQSHMPVWIAVELLDFGPLSIALSGMRFTDLQRISTGYGIPRPHLLTTWIRSLCGVRNVCAHHARLWNKPLVDQPSLTKAGEIPELGHLRQIPGGNTRLYAAAAIIRYLLKRVNPRSKWHERLASHIATFPTRPTATVSAMGFPTDWHSLPLWK